MSTNYNRLRHMQGLPIGTIVPWSGAPDTIPNGWQQCNGAVVQNTRFPLLYKIIGNVYGGTAGSTFKIPEITDERGVLDIYPGHYTSLNSFPPSAPSTTSKTSDPYWTNILEDINSSNSTDGVSTIDVIASFVNSTNKPNLVARVESIEFTPGGYSATYGIHGRKLSDRHQKWHDHVTTFEANTGVEGNSFKDGNKNCSKNKGGKNDNCDFKSKGGVTANTLGSRNVPSTSSGCIVKGGSTANINSMKNDGDGEVGGDMYATANGGNFRVASSLSSEVKTWADASAHTHSAPDTKFKCNVNITSSYTFYDVSSNNITIVQAPPDAATINTDSATPNLSMLFIIRAY